MKTIRRSGIAKVAAWAVGVVIAGLVADPAIGAAGRTPGGIEVSRVGELTYAVPIKAPGGIRGLAPQIALVYEHRRAAFSAGIGWTIGGLSRITRCAKTTAQDGAADEIQLDTTDRFCLDGNRLRLESTGTYGAVSTTYRMQVDTVARVTIPAVGTAGDPQWFRVEQRDGMIYEYGNTANSRIESLVPGKTTTAYIWALSAIRDRLGNSILFTYEEDGAPNGAYRISGIEWTGRSVSPVVSPMYRMAFTYQAKPAGDVSATGQYVAGGGFRETKRLTQIEITHVPTTTRVRRYGLAYEATLSNTNLSRLASVTECAGSDLALDCYPPTTFTYQNGTPGVASEVSSAITVNRPMTIDINGDGRTDVVYSSTNTSGTGTWRYLLANGVGGFAAPVDSGIANTNFSNAIASDYDGDLRDDILVPFSGNTWWVIRWNGSGLAAPVNTTTATPSGGFSAFSTDWNGDGRDDLAWGTGTAGYVQLRNAAGAGYGVAGASVVAAPGCSPGWTFFLGQPGRSRAREIDVNGDGIRDFGLSRACFTFPGPLNTAGFVVLGAGQGQWQIYSGSNTLYGNVFGDFDADGYTDVAFVGPTGALNYRRSTGATFAPAVAVTGTFPSLDFGKSVVRDWNGDGLDDVLVPNSTTGTWMVFVSNGTGLTAGVSTGVATGAPTDVLPLDANGDGLDDIGYVRSSGVFAVLPRAGATPDLLTVVQDGYGNQTNVSYVSTSQSGYTSGGTAPVFPNRELVGPLIVVRQLAVSNAIGGFRTQTYDYSASRVTVQGSDETGAVGSGFTNLPNPAPAKGLRSAVQYAGNVNQTTFKGFGSIQITDSETNLVTVRDYSVDDPPILGMMTGHRLFQAVGSPVQLFPIQVTEIVPDKVTATNGDTLRAIPYARNVTTREYEFLGPFDRVMKRTATRVINSIDAYGEPTSITETATEPPSGANGARPGASYTATTTLTGFQPDTVTGPTWCHGKPGTTTIASSHTAGVGGTQITRTLNQSWDLSSLCRLNSETVAPGTPYSLTRSLGYDVYGNVSLEGVTGRKDDTVSETRQTTYDYITAAAEPGRFVLKRTNAENEATQMDWNVPLGVQLSETDPNGIAVSWGYDVFGRLTQETRGADNTRTTWSYNECAAVSGGCMNANNKMTVVRTELDSGGAYINDQIIYLDRWERILSTSSRTLTGAYDRNDREYNARGVLQREAAPCLWSGCVYYWTNYTYDALNRPLRVERPISDANATLQATTISYEGLSTRVTDAEGNPRTAIKDALGRHTRSVDALGAAVTFDHDGFGSVVRVSDSQSNVLASMTYDYGADAFRRKLIDLNAGTGSTPGEWLYTPNAFGDVYRWSDPKGQAFSATFDRLSRMRSRTQPEGTDLFDYGVTLANRDIGQLTRAVGHTGYSETYSYDASARPSQTRVTTEGTDYFYNYTYNTLLGTLGTLTYPTSTGGCRLQVTYAYQYGQLKTLTDSSAAACGSAGTVYWNASAVNAANQVTTFNRGPNVVTNSTFDFVTQWLRSTTVGLNGGSGLQNLGYAYNRVGMLTQRQDNRGQVRTENIFPDALYRVDTTTLNGTLNLDVDYDVLGRITKKTDHAASGTWTYDPNRKHQLLNAAGTLAYAYDANGNATTRGSDTLSWTSYNYLAAFTQGSASNQFLYGPNRERWKQSWIQGGVATETTRTLGGLLETVTTSAGTDYRHWITGDGSPVALVSRKDAGANPNQIRYPIYDHLDSISGWVDNNGTLTIAESYSAYGQRRDGDTWQLPLPSGQLSTIDSISKRGFGQHAHVSGSPLVHMNGRVMDPASGRFLSPDPIQAEPGNPGAWDPYAYVGNSPLDYKDPSGMARVCITLPTQRFIGGFDGFGGGFGPDGGGGFGGFGEFVTVFVTSCFDFADGLFLPRTGRGDVTFSFGGVPGANSACPAGACAQEGQTRWDVTGGVGADGSECVLGTGPDCYTQADDILDTYSIVPIAAIEKWAARFIGKAAGKSGIKITERGLEHVQQRHVVGGARTAGKSVFAEGEDVVTLVRRASSVKRIPQAGGNFERIIDAGRTIGTDRATGQPTTVYTVITNAADELITAFPGRP